MKNMFETGFGHVHTSIKQLVNPLNAIEIKKCIHLFKNESIEKTDVEINEVDGSTVMLKGEDKETIEKDWLILQSIANSIIAQRSNRQKSDGLYLEECIADPDRVYMRPYELLSSNVIHRFYDGRIYITDHIAQLMLGLDNLFQTFAEKEQARNFYAEPLWSLEDVEKFGYKEESKDLCQIGHFEDLNKNYWQNATCDNIWKSLRDSNIEGFKTYTSIGTCCRNENGNFYFFERMKTFHMREIVAVGSPEEITAFRERAMSFVKSLGNEIGINAVFQEANDPFFMIDKDPLSKDNQELDLPDIVKIEYRLRLYDDKTLACASFNVHGNFFSQQFNYRPVHEEQRIWTSCAAFGIERWIWALIVQFGVDAKQWPQSLRNLLQ